MKKAGSKKLTLSLKTNTHQKKISCFFIPSKTRNINNGEKVEDKKNDSVIDQYADNKGYGGPLSKNLCPKCLRKSPTFNSDVCGECNITKNVSLVKELPLIENPSLVESFHSKIGCNLKADALSSPDLIPATPPVKHTKRINSKSVKRKCFFEDENSLSKKDSSWQTDQNVHIMSKKLKKPESDYSKENKSFCSETDNDKSVDPVCKPAVHYDTNEDSLKKNCVENNKTVEESTQKLQTLSKTDNPQNHNNLRKIDENLSKNLGCHEKIFDKDIGNLTFKNVTQVTGKKSATECSSTNNMSSEAPTTNVISPCEVTLGNGDSEGNKLIADSINDFEIGIENVLEDFTFSEDELHKPLRLDISTRCKVTSVEQLKACGEVVLTLTSCDVKDADPVTCVLRGSWTNCGVSVGDIVNVTARPVTGQEGCWVVDDESGLLVVHPDTLISGTTVVGSLFCMRRSVLSDMYRGIDSDSSIMVTGSFLHQLLQEVLKKKVSTLDGIKKVLDEFTKTRYFIHNLYSSSMRFDKTVETLQEFVPNIHNFIQKYLSADSKYPGTSTWTEDNSWTGSIDDIADIEENIWSPSLGLKGKIDVTVKTSSKKYREKVMPLELKTGRASFSAEHRGQVILYTMMMSELGKTVDSGLLLYLREGVMKGVPVGASERRDLMLLRNELVTQLKASHSVVVISSQEIAAPVLPPPINHHSACGKCPYLTLCSAALRLSGCDEVSEKNPLRQLSESSISHLEVCHIVYVFHWTGLLRLEHTETLLNSPSLHHIWTMPPVNRAKRGSCIPKVKLVNDVVEVLSGSYQHVFHCDNGVTGNFTEGDYLVVSSASRPAVATGPLTQVTQSQLTLLLERDLSAHQVTENVWYLDKYESQSGLIFNMTNLGCLLDNTEQAKRLRKAVIDKKVPEFSPKLSSRVLKASVDLLSELNDQQRKAIFRALAADHYILIKGMPGTGKTATIVALVQLAVRLGHSVLITSHTHSAVDNVLLRLRGKIDFLRLGSAHKLHSELAQSGESVSSFTSPDDLHAFYNSKSVVGVTCLGSSHPLLTRRKFDLCIVDEATQVHQPTILRPLFSAQKFILIGDPDQLPPLVRSSKAKKLGLGESLFARLDRPAVTTELNLQYRMNQTITDLANCLTYGGKLKCGNAEIAAATLSLPLTALNGEPAWVGTALSNSLKKAVVVVDTGASEALACVNTTEADIVQRILAVLTKGLSDDKVGVIAPYRAQVEHLRREAKSHNKFVEVNTVDQYQGRDKEVIIYSCTRSSKPTESDILGDKNRLTVAITRARHKLIIIGNVTLLRGYSIFDVLFNSIPPSCIVSIS